MAGLLHDTVEDTDTVTLSMIEESFGYECMRIVEGETKFSKLTQLQQTKSSSSKEDLQVCSPLLVPIPYPCCAQYNTLLPYPVPRRCLCSCASVRGLTAVVGSPVACRCAQWELLYGRTAHSVLKVMLRAMSTACQSVLVCAIVLEAGLCARHDARRSHTPR